MNIEEILKKPSEERNNIKYNLLDQYLEKSEKWLYKHNDDSDFFDRYLSLFIAVNIIYSLWRKINKPDSKFKDKRDFLGLGNDLIKGSVRDNLIKSYPTELFEILKRGDFYIEVGNWGNKEEIQKAFKRSSNDSEKFKIIWESFYSVRCNLIHGEKGYSSRQEELLKFIHPTLKDCLVEIIKKLNVLNKVLSISLKINKDLIVKSARGKKYKILDIDDKNIFFLREHAKDKEREYKIHIKDLFVILYEFNGREEKLNSALIKEYVGGLQSPVITILKYCNI